MTYLHLSRTRTRERSPSPPYRPLVRRDTKRSRIISLTDDSDDGHDDYPYSNTHRPVRTSRALTLRNQPSQLERYNIWSDRHKSEDRDEDYARESERVHRHTSSRYRHDDDDCFKSDPEEREFRFRLAETFNRRRSFSLSPSPPTRHHTHTETRYYPSTSTDVFRRKEKYVDEGWETRQRSRSRSRETQGRADDFWGEGGFWGDKKGESSDEKWSRYRKIKRTKTEEWRPLTGWRRVA